MGGDGEAWRRYEERVPRLEIAIEAEERFHITLPDEVDQWLTLQDAYKTIIFSYSISKKRFTY